MDHDAIVGLDLSGPALCVLDVARQPKGGPQYTPSWDRPRLSVTPYPGPGGAPPSADRPRLVLPKLAAELADAGRRTHYPRFVAAVVGYDDERAALHLAQLACFPGVVHLWRIGGASDAPKVARVTRAELQQAARRVLKEKRLLPPPRSFICGEPAAVLDAYARDKPGEFTSFAQAMALAIYFGEAAPPA